MNGAQRRKQRKARKAEPVNFRFVVHVVPETTRKWSVKLPGCSRILRLCIGGF